MAETEAPEHALLLDDIGRALKRSAKSKYLEASKEFSDECYPLMAAIVEHFGERIERFEAALDTLIEQTESFLQPDLTQQIMSTLELGRLLGEAVLKLVPGVPLDEVALKRLHASAVAYMTASEMTAESVEEATVEEAAAPEAPTGDEEDNEEDEDDEDADTDVGMEAPPADSAPAAEVE